MRITPLSADEAVAVAVEALGFDSDAVDLAVPEVLAAAIRRAASFECPVTPRRLATVVRRAATGLVDHADDEEQFPARAMVDVLAAYGDLIEVPVRTEGGSDQRMLFLAEPSFVELGETVLLVGIRAEGIPFLSGAAADRIECEGHVRRLAPGHELTAEELKGLGLREVSIDHWLGHPPLCTANELVAEYDSRLAAAGPAGTIEGCTILDSSTPTTYYRGRWRSVSPKDSGRYVARRAVAYRAPLWCYAEVNAGEVVQVLDLPVQDRLNRACDEAWRLQAAIDALRGSPQLVRAAPSGQQGVAVLHLLSPPPAWVQRRLDAVGRPIPRQRSLLSYAVSTAQVEVELDFLQSAMWADILRNGDNE